MLEFISNADVGYFIVGAALMFTLLNVAAWYSLPFLRSLITPRENSSAKSSSSACPDYIRQNIKQWYGFGEEDWQAYINEDFERRKSACVHEEFTEFKHPSFNGRYFKFSPHGFRHVEDQGQWPPLDKTYNILFFGGSTTLNVGPDWTAIPSYLQKYLNDQSLQKPVCVYNFGRGAYFSTQERILFQQLMMGKGSFDMAIFLDGLNEFYFYEGAPTTKGLFSHSLEESLRATFSIAANQRSARPQWGKIADFFMTLPLAHTMELLSGAMFGNGSEKQMNYVAPLDLAEEVYDEVIKRYIHNKNQIEAIAEVYNVTAVFAWQPVPGYKYNLDHHIAIKRMPGGLLGHERSGVGYPIMKEYVETHPQGDAFIWLADIQEDMEKPLYVDHVHYTAEFSRIIAEKIGSAIVERGLFYR